MSVRTRARMLVMASVFAAAASTMPVAVQFASAAGVHQTGPTGAQCNIKQQGGDFVDPSNSDTTNNANISLSPTTGGGGPFMQPAGCDLVSVLPPAPPLPPTGDPVRQAVPIKTAGNAPGS